MPRGKRQVRNFGFLSPNKRTEKLAVLRELFALDAMSEADEEESAGGGDALSHSDDEQEPTACSLGFHPRRRAANILCQLYCNRKVSADGGLLALGKDSRATLRQLRLDFR